MGSIIFKVSIIVLLVGFLAFLAWDDYRNRKAREAEEKQAALTGPERSGDERKADREGGSAD